MCRHFEVSDGVDVVMRLPSASYGALYQTMLLDQVIACVKAGDVTLARTPRVGDSI